jgi:hypothetical protein
VTLFGTFGAAGVAHLTAGNSIPLAFTFATFDASIVLAATVLFRWTHSPLTKGTPITVPASIEQAEREILEKKGMSTF